jgi:hypothetical protein
MPRIRQVAAAAALAALMALAAGTALAGGWADVTLVDGAEDPPIAGEEREIRFQLLQHGVTAVDFGEVQLTAAHQDTGEAITVAATSHGGGMWSATVTFPIAGDWQIGIAHSDLLTSEPATLTVGQVTGSDWVPGAISMSVFGLMATVVLGSAVLTGRRRRSSTAEPAGAPLRVG